MSRKLVSALCLAGALVACRTGSAAYPSEPAAAAQPTAARAPSGLDLVPLEIHSSGRTHRFTVEVARTSEQQARGLMFRNSLGADEGMIFPFSPARPASFWMHNTYIPLDMIFIREDGTIARIAADTTPLSDEPVPSGEPVAAVLEIKGGRAAELGIRENDHVAWPG